MKTKLLHLVIVLVLLGIGFTVGYLAHKNPTYVVNSGGQLIVEPK